MKIYLASRYTRREELLRYAQELAGMGHIITSRWIYGSHQISDDGLSDEACEELRKRFALEDYIDLLTAECVVSFTEPPKSPFSRGGRHVEFGMAIASSKRCIVVGYRENVFHCLPGVQFYPDWESLNKALTSHPEREALELGKAGMLV